MALFLICVVSSFALTSSVKLDWSSPMPTLLAPTKTIANRTRLSIAAVSTYGGYTFPLGPLCTEATRFALDAIQNASLLDRYELTVEPLDDMCSASLGIKLSLQVLTGDINIAQPNYTRNRIPLLLGPSCTTMRFTGSQMKHFNHVGVSPVAAAPDIFTHRSLFSSYFSLSPSAEMYDDAVPAFIKSNGWQKVYLLTETYEEFNQREDIMARNLARLNISLAGASKVLILSGTLPTNDQYNLALREMAAFNPRVIVINTGYGPLMACWLYRYKLYGPDYVILYYGFGFFLTNDGIRFLAPNCTEPMLFEVLKSVIFFSQGMPINMEDDAIDDLGTSARVYEETLKSRIEQPELRSKWWPFRSACYDSVVGSAWALNAVEQALQKDNDTLLNWVASSENFKTNGSYIYSLMKNSFERLRYKGLTIDRSSPTNSRTGVTGFWQLVEQQEASMLPLALKIKPVPIASYDNSKAKPVPIKGPYHSIWLTFDGQAPPDSLRTTFVKDSIVHPTANAVMKAIAGLLLLMVLTFLVINIKTISPIFSNAMPKMNSLILIGNALVLCFVLILPGDGDTEMLGAYCMAASLSVVLGFSLLTSAVVAKMESARMLFKLFVMPTKSGIFLRMISLTTGARPSNGTGSTNVIARQKRSSTAPASPLPRPKPEDINAVFQGCSKLALGFSVLWSVIESVIMAVCFAIEPIRSARFDRTLVMSPLSISLAHQYYTNACSLNGESIVVQVMVGILIASYALIFLRSIVLAFLLRTATIPEIADLHFTRFISYGIGIAGFAGGAVIYGFFAHEPGMLEISTSSLAIIVVAINITVIFIPKIYGIASGVSRSALSSTGRSIH